MMRLTRVFAVAGLITNRSATSSLFRFPARVPSAATHFAHGREAVTSRVATRRRASDAIRALEFHVVLAVTDSEVHTLESVEAGHGCDGRRLRLPQHADQRAHLLGRGVAPTSWT